MVMFNSKSARRGSSGKLVTIYPADDAELELVLKELDGILVGVEGPYILSDLRYADGPLFVRYGGFVERHCLSAARERVLALEDVTAGWCRMSADRSSRCRHGRPCRCSWSPTRWDATALEYGEAARNASGRAAGPGRARSSGFRRPATGKGVEVDRYALAYLCLGLFGPQTTMVLQLHPAEARQLADLIVETVPVPKATTDAAVRTILGSTATTDDELAALPMPGRAGLPEVRDAICRAIIASATPERDDRLFPGDIAQSHPGGGTSLAYGAAGVLYALARTGAGRFPEYDDWLRRQALKPRTPQPTPAIKPGPGRVCA